MSCNVVSSLHKPETPARTLNHLYYLYRWTLLSLHYQLLNVLLCTQRFIILISLLSSILYDRMCICQFINLTDSSLRAALYKTAFHYPFLRLFFCAKQEINTRRTNSSRINSAVLLPHRITHCRITDVSQAPSFVIASRSFIMQMPVVVVAGGLLGVILVRLFSVTSTRRITRHNLNEPDGVLLFTPLAACRHALKGFSPF